MKTRAIALAGLVAAGCAAGAGPGLGDTVINDFIDENYDTIDVSVFAGSGGRASIYGATRDGASAEEIAAAIRLPAFVNPRTIRAAPEGTRQSGPHLVLVINPQAGATPKKACRGEAKGGQAGSELRVLGVFCSSYGRPATEGLFVANGSPVPSDPDFRKRMSVLMTAIMPTRNPNFQGDRPRVRG